MQNPTPTPTSAATTSLPPNAATPTAPTAPPAQRLEVLFRHVLHTAPGRHLLQLIVQYRKEAVQ